MPPPFDASPKTIRRTAVLVAIASLMVSLFLAYRGLGNELSGKAFYSTGARGRGEIVTREEAPAKFRQATNLLWASSIFSLTMSVISIIFYRKIDDNLAEPF